MTSGHVASIVCSPRACALARTRRRHAVRREHGDGPGGDFGLLIDEDRAALAQLVHDVFVVHDLLAHVHRRTVQLQGAFHGLHGAIHARAVPARRGQQHLLDGVGHRAVVGTAVIVVALAQSCLLVTRSSHRGGCLVPAPGGDPLAHARGRASRSWRARRRSIDEFQEQIRWRLHLVPRYRHKLASHRARQRAPGVDRRSELQPGVSRAQHRAARARRTGSSCRHSPRGSSPSNSTAPSRCGRCG